MRRGSQGGRNIGRRLQRGHGATDQQRGGECVAGTLYFTFDIPQGQPGEVSLAQLNDASSGNSNAVAELSLSPSDPDLATVVAKVNELILALRR